MGSRRGALAGLHILVAEDNEDAREILRTVLEYFGAFVVHATSAEEALGASRRALPDLVIADMRLGDHDATWLVREARKLRSRAPVIAISGLDFDDRQLRDHGFAAYLRKPLDHDRLVDVILTVVKKR